MSSALVLWAAGQAARSLSDLIRPESQKNSVCGATKTNKETGVKPVRRPLVRANLRCVPCARHPHRVGKSPAQSPVAPGGRQHLYSLHTEACVGLGQDNKGKGEEQASGRKKK